MRTEDEPMELTEDLPQRANRRERQGDTNGDNLRHLSNREESRCLNSHAVRAALHRAAYGKLLDRMAHYGSALSSEHRLALSRILRTFIWCACGHFDKRQGVPLPMGGGKTLATECFAWAINHLDLDVGIVVAVYRLRDMKAVYDDLIEMGVPADDIGVRHGENDANKMTVEPTTGNRDRRIMLVTHARLQGGDENLPQYGFYKGRPRDLVIYDESLVSTDNWALSVKVLVETVAASSGVLTELGENDTPATRAALDYLGTVKDRVIGEMARLEAGRKPRRIPFPKLPEGFTVADLTASLDPKYRKAAKPVFEHAGGAGRGVRLQGRNGLVWYEVSVPDALDRMVILDASLVVRMLPELSGEIETVKRFPANVISYEDVILYHMQQSGARGEIDDIFASRRRLNGYCREIARVVHEDLPANEAVNFFIFADKNGRDYIRPFRKAITEAGVDLAEELEPGVPRFNIITWGQETATNKFVRARHTIFVSVLHRDWLDIASDITAANRSLTTDKNYAKAKDIFASEVAHSVAQAIGRSAVRVARKGKAGRGTVWLPMVTPGVIELLVEVALPGIDKRSWRQREEGWSSRDTKTAAIERAVMDILGDRREDISSAAIKKAVKAAGVKVSKRTWEDAMKHLMEDPPADWTKTAKSWTYTPQHFEEN